MCFEIETTTHPKAKKEHRCIWCGEKILVGEKYTRQKGIFDGEWQDNPWHDDCLEGADDHFTSMGEYCWSFDPYGGERYRKQEAQ
jgi:DNA-directed RNA polymerase subunit RPC12/RpoP